MSLPPSHKQFEFASDFAELDHLISEVDRFIRSHTFDEDLAYRVVLLTTEAATNAIEHGNQLDPGKKVRVELSVGAAGLTVRVEDEGPGFKASEVKNPLAEENLLEEGGRGIFLIASMADEHAFELEGRRICMTFRL